MIKFDCFKVSLQLTCFKILLMANRYFKKILIAFSSGTIYRKYVQLPCSNVPVHSSIRDNLKYYPFFKDAIGAINGTHIACTPPADQRDAS